MSDNIFKLTRQVFPTERWLLEMVKKALDAMRSENMPCPWCANGRLNNLEDEHHDDFCDLLKHKGMFDEEKT